MRKLAALLLITLCSCNEHRIAEGRVVGKRNRIWASTQFIGKGVPITIMHNDHILTLKATINDTVFVEDFYVCQSSYDSISIGDVIKIKP